MSTVRSTPALSAPIRPIFERAGSGGQMELYDTIRIDTLTESVRAKLLSDPESGVDFLDELAEEAAFMKQRIATEHTSSHTDFYRRIANADFAVEKVLAPLFFGNNSNRAQHVRAQIANGISGKSIETVEQLLIAKSEYGFPLSATETKELNTLRGALQEHTMAGILNIEDDGDFIVVPASAEEDLLYGTDLIAYYRGQDGQNYRSDISVKSSEIHAVTEWNRWRNHKPQPIVLHAGQFGNTNFDISRRYVDYLYHGDDSDQNTETIHAAALALRMEFNSQVERKGAFPIDRIPTTDLNAIEAAVFHRN